MVTKYKIAIPVYELNLHVAIYEDMARATKDYSKHLDGFSLDNDDGCTFPIHRGRDFFDDFCIIFYKAKLSHNLIAHETFHVARRILLCRGIQDEEAQAWLCGWLTGEIYKRLEKDKLI